MCGGASQMVSGDVGFDLCQQEQLSPVSSRIHNVTFSLIINFSEIRRLLEHVRKLVENRYKRAGQGRQNRELPWQSVSAFFFLRFIVPAILHPYRYGLYPSMWTVRSHLTSSHGFLGHPGPTVQRSLTLIAKVIQSLANLNAV